MVSRSIFLLSLASAISNGAVLAASSSSSSSRNLRAAASPQQQAGASSDDIPVIVNTRSLQENNATDDAESATNATDANATDANATDATTTTVTTTIALPADCLNLLSASANENGMIKKENYFVFTDGMSNGYYSFNNLTSYSDLPMENKFGFVTLSCQCLTFGGRGNCCQGDRAKLEVGDLNVTDPASMTEQIQLYIKDICDVTSTSIGENKLPPTGELPTTARPTTSIAPSAAPTVDPLATSSPTAGAPSTSSPTITNADGINETPVGQIKEERLTKGLGAGAYVGIAIAGACVLSLVVYLASKRTKDDDSDSHDGDLSQMSRHETTKEHLAITPGGELNADAPRRIESPDATNSMTASDVSSMHSMSTAGNNTAKQGNSAYYASNSLLQPRPDEESVLSNSDGPSFFDSTIDEEGDGVEEGIEIAGDRSLLDVSSVNTSSNSGGSDNLDHAIESGNWEAVAASAAAMVKNNESSTSSGVSV